MRFLFLFVFLLGACQTTYHYPAAKCRKYIIAPPAHYDPLVSEKIVRYWRKISKKNLGKCDKILPMKSYEQVFTTVNIDHVNGNTMEDYNPSVGKTLAKRTGGTHIVFLDLLPYNKKTYLRPRIASLSSGLPSQDENLTDLVKLNIETRDVTKTSRLNTFLIRSISLVPNTFLGGTSQSDLFNDKAQDLDLIETREISNVPPIVSAFSVTNTIHPEGYDDYDFTTRIFPAINFGYMDREYIYSNNYAVANDIIPNEGDQLNYRLTLFYTSITINYELNFFTPLGTTFIGVGFGPGYSSYRDSFDNTRRRFTGFSRTLVGHRFFASDRIVIQFAADINSSNPRMVNNAVFESGGYNTTTIQIGYFFPESKSWLRKKL